MLRQNKEYNSAERVSKFEILMWRYEVGNMILMRELNGFGISD